MSGYSGTHPLPGLDSHHARLQRPGERRFITRIERPLCGIGDQRVLDPAHDGAACGEPFAPHLAARQLARFQEVINGVGGHAEQSRNVMHAEDV